IRTVLATWLVTEMSMRPIAVNAVMTSVTIHIVFWCRTIGTAIANVLYDPVMQPMIMVKAKPLIPGPPQMYMITTVMNTVSTVRMVLDSVWLMASFISFGESVASRPRFSRMRSKMTIESLME